MQKRSGTRKANSKSQVCSFCQVNPRRPNQRTCRRCHAAYMRDTRRRLREEMTIR